MSKKVYLAGGMEFAEDGKSWRNQSVIELARAGIDTWEPYEEEAKMFDEHESPVNIIKLLDKEKDYLRLHQMMHTIVCMDLKVVSEEVDALMVKYDQSVLKGAGTHAEISVATMNTIPVHAWIDGLTLQEIPTWAIGCFSTISFTFEETINKIKRNLNETT